MQTDLSLFLGEAADSFTDWLSELLNKLQNITAETLEKQFKAQQRAEKTGQGSNSERVLMSLEKKKKDVESVAAAAAVASAKKAKTASDQPPTGDYIAIQTDDVIEGLEEEEIDPPAAKQSRPSSANSRPHSSSSSKKGNDPSHKEPPSLVEARQVGGGGGGKGVMSGPFSCHFIHLSRSWVNITSFLPLNAFLTTLISRSHRH